MCTENTMQIAKTEDHIALSPLSLSLSLDETKQIHFGILKQKPTNM